MSKPHPFLFPGRGTSSTVVKRHRPASGICNAYRRPTCLSRRRRISVGNRTRYRKFLHSLPLSFTKQTHYTTGYIAHTAGGTTPKLENALNAPISAHCRSAYQPRLILISWFSSLRS